MEFPLSYKEYKIYCNSLRCPLCNSQLDGNIHPQYSILYCVQNNEEYVCQVNNILGIFTESIYHHYFQWGYIIACVQYIEGTYKTTFSRVNLDNIKIHRKPEIIGELDSKIPKVFKARLEEDEFLKKLKLYLVFS